MKKVLVTGGSNGIGKAICERLSSKDLLVIGTSRNPENHQSSKIELIPLDVTKEESIVNAFNLIQKKWGHIDVLINNAGIGFMGPIELSRPEHVRMAWKTNVYGLMRTTQIMLPLIRKSEDGRIINIGSIGGKMGLPYRGWYSAAKASLEILGESLSIELKPDKIQVCTLLPGDVKTNIGDSRLEPSTEELGSYRKKYIRMKEILSSEMEQAMSADKVAQKVETLLEKKKMPIKRVVGSWLHKLTPVIKNLLPQKWFQSLIIRHYK